MENLTVQEFNAICEQVGTSSLFEKISDKDQFVTDFWEGEAVMLEVNDRQFFIQIKVEER